GVKRGFDSRRRWPVSEPRGLGVRTNNLAPGCRATRLLRPLRGLAMTVAAGAAEPPNQRIRMTAPDRLRPPSPADSDDVAQLARLAEAVGELRVQVSRTIVGQEEVVRGILTAVLGGGHALLIGVPGLAKTLMVQTVAEALNLSFNRVQFTPDLMPSDITGTEIIEEDLTTGRRAFRFVRGPVFANVVLADEINRTPPKTQAALLQSMQEHVVTVGGETYRLPDPFFVLATQNPIEQEGTYPLPEAQLDRFMLELRLDYPSREEEEAIVEQTTGSLRSSPSPVLDAESLLAMQALVRRIPVSKGLVRAAVSL